MANKHMGRCRTSPVPRDMQIKATRRYCLMPLRTDGDCQRSSALPAAPKAAPPEPRQASTESVVGALQPGEMWKKQMFTKAHSDGLFCV